MEDNNTKYKIRMIKKFLINFAYFINCILFPPAKVMFVLWTISWISTFPSGTGMSPVKKIIIVLFGYFALCGIADLLFYKNKIKYLNYKTKIIQNKIQRLKKLLKEIDPVEFKLQHEGGYGSLSVAKIQRRYCLDFNKANEIINMLESKNYVGKENGCNPRELLCEESIVWKYIETVFPDYINSQDKANIHDDVENSFDFDSMEGHHFEYFCADILRQNGFINVEVTQGSGDHGIDILAEKDDISYAIQCKCYTSNIGNAAVQQAHTGKSLYKKDVAVVMTNRYFTQQAKDEAEQIGVKLWDRDKLNDLIDKAKQ
ncbi:MAG: restriction endonuclease [Acetatifactor sp.]